MAGEWIKMRTNLWDDPRVARLCDLTDQGEAAVVGGLYWLWAMADEHTEDGLLPGLTARAIDRKTGVNGLGDALISIGWLSATDAGVSIVHFDEHNGASAKKRCSTAKRVASHRSGNDDVTQTALQDEQESVTSALAREEKIREEKNKEEEEERKPARAPRKPSTNLEPLDLVPDGVELQHARDWRTARKCPITQTAWDELKAEAKKAGITPGEAVRICAIKSWRGFDSTWKWQQHAKTPPTTADANAEAARILGFSPDEVIDA